MVTVIHEQRQTALPNARAAGDALWLDAAEIEQSLGWAWKDEGLCRGDVCLPLPRRLDAPLMDGDRMNAAAFWRHLGRPVVRDASSSAWVFGNDDASRARRLASLQAPDFELPDLQGQLHRLSDHRGSKVLLVTWASW